MMSLACRAGLRTARAARPAVQRYASLRGVSTSVPAALAAQPAAAPPAAKPPAAATPPPAPATPQLPVHNLYDVQGCTVGVPRETAASERRVAQTPETVAQLIKKGFSVVVEKGAGAAANFPDSYYERAGAKLGSSADVFKSNVVLKVRAPTPEEINQLKANSALLSFVWPAQSKDLLSALARQRVTTVAMDQVPRISRAQVFDALSSMSNIAGYRAVIEATNAYGRFLTGQITAAGKVPPSKVLVIGGGVAGLSAIATARSLGAIVRAFDTRPAVKEQVESLGAEFLELKGFTESGEGGGGYAKEMSKEFIDAEMKLFADQAKDVDIIITTALIPGKPAPKLILKHMVEAMREGSVVVDLAAEAGGNCELTTPGQAIKHKGVTVIGYSDLVSRLPTQASSLYATNVSKLLLSMLSKDSSKLVLDMNDDVVRLATVTHAGETTWPAKIGLPPGLAGAVASTKKTAPVKVSPEEQKKLDELASYTKTKNTVVGITGISAGLLGMGMIAPDLHFAGMMTTFALAGIVGYQVVWGVTPALHSPLMSVTNAVSGITAVGGLTLMGGGLLPSTTAQGLAAAAATLSAVNVAGGFVMTQRMLEMFRRKTDPSEHKHLYLIPAATIPTLYGLALAAGYDSPALHEMAGLAGAVLCIGAIGGLSSQTTSRAGNMMGMMGIGTGIMATLGTLASHVDTNTLIQMGSSLAVGGGVGYAISKKVQITELPQLVAAFHSFVGAAATLTAGASYLNQIPHLATDPTVTLHLSTDWTAAVIGAMTFSGSLVAFGKLQGLLGGKPLQYKGRDTVNALLAAGSVGSLGVMLANPTSAETGLAALGVSSALATGLGWQLTAGVGGADVPVAITVLNSLSGWALCAEGFMLQNNMLTVVGALVGSSGAILSWIMCVAMNRSLAGVLLGGYGTLSTGKGQAMAITGKHQEINPEAAASLVVNAKKVVIIPGYGLAVARAQYAVADMIKKLRENGIEVIVIVHPVAGRMPGQLNVLLAEAGVDYAIVKEMDEANDEIAHADVALVIGANDTVNLAAIRDPNSPLAGMPVIRAWEAKTSIVLKRSMGTGYADVANPLFFEENNRMLLGDAKKVCDSLLTHVNAHFASK